MKKLISSILLISMTLGLIITQTGCTGKSDPVSKTSYYLDTICRIDIYDMKDMDKAKATEAIEAAFAQCNDYEKLLSKTKEESDIYKINHAGGQPVKCDVQTVELIKAGIQYGKLSDGRFDITVGKVTDLWDFHGEKPQIPAEKAMKKALDCVGYEQIRISGNTVTMENPNGEIDLGGIAKGYIGDRLEKTLKNFGVTSAIISLGGNIMAIGDKQGKDFSIGIEKPYSDQGEIVGSLGIANATVVTSGIYERFFQIDGKKYHHILDVKTGYPVDSDIEGVTLTAASGKSMDCDALSTICLILGVKEAADLIESLDGIEAVIIDQNGNTIKTSGIDSYTEKN